jgi:hypothetical protein
MYTALVQIVRYFVLKNLTNSQLQKEISHMVLTILVFRKIFGYAT